MALQYWLDATLSILVVFSAFLTALHLESNNMHNFSFSLKQPCKFLAFMISGENLGRSPVYLFFLSTRGKDKKVLLLFKIP